MTYFTADNHFGHKSIINLCNRPFSSIEEMDELMIDGWNKRVKDNDDIYIVGDLMFRSGKRPEEYLDKLHGKKHLVSGNHDIYWFSNLTNPDKYFVSVNQIEYLVLEDGKRIILCHYPMLEWNHYHKGAYHIFGHIHNRCNQPWFKYVAENDRMLNAGVDINGFVPVTMTELIANNTAFKEYWQNNKPV